MEYQQMVDKLAGVLSAKRLSHSQEVSMVAVEMARRFGCDEAKAEIAGLLHDCARYLSDAKLIEISSTMLGLSINEVEEYQPVLLHAPIGAKIASAEYQIKDADILEAIAQHTVGGAGMTKLAKIIYLADFIEPGREFPGVDNLRSLAEKDLDEALLAAYEHSIKYIIDQRGLIHPATIEGRNELIKNMKNND